MLLLVVMFLASATRHVRDVQMNPPVPFVPPVYNMPTLEDLTGTGPPPVPATQPTGSGSADKHE
jgi:hypothetical protein